MVTATHAFEQRVRALDAFLADAHGARRAVRDGVVPAGLLPANAPAAAPPAAWLVVVPFAADGTPDVAGVGAWFGTSDVQREAVRRALHRTAPDVRDPHLVVVGDDPLGLGLPVVAPDELDVVGDEVRRDGRRVDVVWRRAEVGERLARPVARGRVRLANAPGAELAGRALPFVEDLVRWACGEEPEPLLAGGRPAVACWDGCGWQVVQA